MSTEENPSTRRDVVRERYQFRNPVDNVRESHWAVVGAGLDAYAHLQTNPSLLR
jgi:hypothetical protein